MNPRINVAGVSKIYHAARRPGYTSLLAALRYGAYAVTEEIRALDGVSLIVAEGERVGIIGRNGAGKTTLLQLIAGLATPTAGTIEVAGHVQAVMTLGMVLRDEVTGRENIYLDAEIQGASRAATGSIIDRIIEFSELGDFIDLPVRTYSSGMKARLAFSMIAFIEPEILIIDEALSVGDFHFARKASARMKELSRTGRAVLVVSHSMQSIVELCSRCIWLDRGRIVMNGEPNMVTKAYSAAVNAADEAVLRRKFDEGPPLPPGVPGATLSQAMLVKEEVELDRPLLLAGRNASIRVTGSAERLAWPDLLLRIVRIDGTLISENRFSEHREPGVLRRAFKLTLDMHPVVLGPSVYRAELLLLDRDTIVTGRSLVFEVRTDDRLIGGVPMLLYPSSVSVRAAEEIIAR